MQTIEDRLATVVSLLPATQQKRFAAPFGNDETTDSRLVEAVQALAKVEGLVCHTLAELVRAKARLAVPVARPPAAHPPGSDDEATALAARFAACKTPQAQTAFWRALTPWERTVLTRCEVAELIPSSPRARR